MPTASPDSFRQITDVVSESLKQAFDEVCPKRYGGGLELERIDTSENPRTVSFALQAPRVPVLRIDVAVTHVGGNVYDITAHVEGGEARRFTCSEPSGSGSSLSIAPYLGKKVANHILNEVEKRLGKTMLRRKMEAEAA